MILRWRWPPGLKLPAFLQNHQFGVEDTDHLRGGGDLNQSGARLASGR